jgi:hypothetical protein
MRTLLAGIVLFVGFTLNLPQAPAQEQRLDIFPIWPIGLDAILRQQTFAPKERVAEGQIGITALRYGDLEVRGNYRLFNSRTPEFTTTQHTLFVNPRWNNWIDLLDWPPGRPINRMLRRFLFGPLQDQVVPYVGLLGGMILPGPGHHAPGYFYGANTGLRFLLTRGASLDVSLEYNRYDVAFEDRSGTAQRWQMLIGIRF